MEVDFLPLNAAEAIALPLPGGRCAVAIDPERIGSDAEARYKLAHELGHCATGSFYNRYAALDLRQKHENRADRWAVRHLVPRRELERALCAGRTEVWELAEYFGVPEMCIRKAFELYERESMR